MLMGEFATAAQHGLPIKVIIVKNNSFRMIRWEQMAFETQNWSGFTPQTMALAKACGGIHY
jgi:thiamine pyrophosphate-dependent acetolactate synthase large subunit-like protein